MAGVKPLGLLQAFSRSGSTMREPMHLVLGVCLAIVRSRPKSGDPGTWIESRARGQKASACPRNALVIGDHSLRLK